MFKNNQIQRETTGERHAMFKLAFAFFIGFLSAMCISNVKRASIIKVVTSFDRPLSAVLSTSSQSVEFKPWHKFIALNGSSHTEEAQGNDGGAWTWCGHVVRYGPNFDRGYISFVANVLQPDSALEFGAGVGLYINTLYKYRAENRDHEKHGLFVGIEPESMLNAQVYERLPQSAVSSILGNLGVSDVSLKSQALQLALDIFTADQATLDSIPMFDVVYSSEVIEHIPAKFHNQTLDFLVSKTKKFMVFGGARPGQGGKGHLGESMKPKEFWIQKLRDERGMIYLPLLSKHLQQSCYNSWDKGQNSFIVANPKYYNRLEKQMKELHIQGDTVDKMLGDQSNVYDLFPEFQKSVVEIQTNKAICTSESRRTRRLMAHI